MNCRIKQGNKRIPLGMREYREGKQVESGDHDREPYERLDGQADRKPNEQAESTLHEQLRKISQP